VKTWVVLLAAGAVLPLLAGCNSPPSGDAPPATAAVTGDRLENGTFYAFAHGGGDLVFSVASNGSADLVLYSGDDERLGHIGVGAERARGRFVLDGVKAGDLVLQALSVNGTLDVRSGGSPVKAFRELPVHIERRVLAQRPMSTLGSFGIPGNGASVDETIDLDLLRAPAEIVVLERANYGSLDIEVEGRSGVVYRASSSSSTFGGAPNLPFVTVDGEKHFENIRDGKLTAHVQASDFGGTVLLEARSFSRAVPVDGGAFASSEVPRFTYGLLPDQPVSFEVHRDAKRLYLWQEDGAACSKADATAVDAEPCADEAQVALFGPDDKRVATIAVPANGSVAVGVSEPGSWVAVLLAGEATLGADRVPGDFELHPIDVREAVSPAQAAGSGAGNYGQDRGALQVAGVPFRLTPTTIMDGATGDLPIGSPFDQISTQCEAPAVSVLRDGETIAAWGYDLGRFSRPAEPSPLEGTLLLGDGELEVSYSDFGPGCERLGVTVEGYAR
jgi:hypothetical protein